MLTLPKQPGTMSGRREFVHPIFVKSTYCGIMTTAKGIMIVARRAIKNASFPRNLIFANANAASDEVNPPKKSTGISTFIVFKIPFMKLPFESTSEYFPIRIGSGKIVSFPERIWFLVIKEVATI